MVPETLYGTDRRMDRWMEKVIYRGGCPTLKIQYFEQSATLFGMKKRRIVNQILLSKICYIGQIYTIAKFIKDEIEKTIAHLYNWKCVLGILDRYSIKVSRKSMDLKIIKSHQCYLERFRAVLTELKE